MNGIESVVRSGIDPKWESREALLRSLKGLEPWPMADVLAYNTRSDTQNVRNLPPVLGYSASGHRMDLEAQILMFQGKPWEQATLAAMGYSMLSHQLQFFWHVATRKIFPNSPQPLRRVDWESMIQRMAMAFVLGRIDEGIYQGYLTHSALNRHFQLELSHEQKHRRGLAFMLRLFASWRGDVEHAWPGYAYDEPIHEAILEAWRTEDPEALKPLLLSACDRHTHQAHPDTEDVFFDFRDTPCTPLEILLLFRLRELAGLENPQLDHPLMAAPFDRLPAMQPACPPDELILGTLARVRADWPEYDSVVSVDAIR